MGEDRRVAAILSTDIVGFGALWQRDEARAGAVRDRQLRLLRQFDGELVQASGDEALALFVSPLRAVDCGLALQAALRGAGDLRLRVGIHVGEVCAGEDGKLRGEGVEVAEHVCRAADPGGIAASGALWDQVKEQSYLVGRRMEGRDVGDPDRRVELFAVGLRGAR
jgi:class 3 adenylate cyclase